MLSEKRKSSRAGRRPRATLANGAGGGEIFGVLGSNGAGKSTLLGALSGELVASAGRVLLTERPLHEWSSLERAQRLAVLPQQSSLSFGFREEEVVAMGHPERGHPLVVVR